MTKRGSGDDVTVAGIIDFEQLKAMEEKLRTALEEADTEENPEESEFASNGNADDEKTVAAVTAENTEVPDDNE